MKRRIKRSYRRMSQDKGSSFANVIYQRMLADTQFADLLPLLVELKTRNTAYEISDANAADGGKTLTILKNEAYNAIMDQLDDIADAVEKLAKGDDKIILTSGFELIQDAKSVNSIATPTDLKADNDPDHTGVAFVKYKADKNAVNTGIEYQKVGETAWKNGLFSTSNSAVLTGLEAGAYHNVRVYSLGSKSMRSDYTELVTVLVS